MKKALVFDIDNTLTPPRRAIEKEMADILKKLEIPFFLVAGSDLYRSIKLTFRWFNLFLFFSVFAPNT